MSLLLLFDYDEQDTHDGADGGIRQYHIIHPEKGHKKKVPQPSNKEQASVVQALKSEEKQQSFDNSVETEVLKLLSREIGDLKNQLQLLEQLKQLSEQERLDDLKAVLLKQLGIIIGVELLNEQPTDDDVLMLMLLD